MGENLRSLQFYTNCTTKTIEHEGVLKNIRHVFRGLAVFGQITPISIFGLLALFPVA